MSKKTNPLFVIYQWIVAYPILVVITLLTAVLTTLLSPISPDSKFAYFPARIWAKIFCFLTFVRVKVSGLEKLNPQQSYVFLLNHQSMFDIFAVYGWLPVIFKWMIKAEIRKIPFIGKACESAGHVFINRSSPIAAKQSLERAEAQLKNGVSLVIFPEGTRTKTGEIGVFKRGAFRVATDLSLPIVPVTIRGSFERLHYDSVQIIPGTIEMIVHEPIETTTYLPDNSSELIQKTRDQIQSSL